ncbi:hypothetical protein CB0940_03157 [Cercospora beticola]|uniref:BTB domain-containing protein n=1 Tax=Cercospora beticola TaxID=122368 RepID=A0A2G5I5N0_CERBT|nr:hypothetical protein CB0940_03157 [Cercospora beticola]PIB00115.1 hypothetical protein CB0940_03157 [Cercospora beticola]
MDILSIPLNQVSSASAPDFPLSHNPHSLAAPTVYSRDFAYADNGPIVVLPARMAAADITNASAKTFAEYVDFLLCAEEDMWDGTNLLKFMLTERLRERLLSGDTVNIYVGRQRKHWILHQNLLIHHSSFCELEFHSHETAPRKDNKLELPEDDPIGFELLVKWLYQGTLEDSSRLDSDEAKYEHAVACHKLWLLCDRFEMVKLKNLAMDQYRRCLNESQLVPDADEINDIYRTSPVGSPFRSLMVKIAARQIMDPEVERDAEAYRQCFESNPDFAIEMVTAIRQMSNGILFNDPTRGDACSYHDHADVSGCPMQGKGKARAPKKTEEGFVNSGARHEQPRSPMRYVELSAERRTPRKLRTPFKSPSAALKYSETPKSLPPKLNGAGAKVEAQEEPNRSISQGGSPFENGGHSGTSEDTLQLRIPIRDARIATNADEESPLLTRSSEKQDASFKLEQSAGPPTTPQQPPIAKRTAHNGHSMNNTNGHFEQGARSGQKVTKSESTKGEGTKKRKLSNRTPRKIREKPPVTIPITNGVSSRADSVISGPRKLRVSSIVRKLNESSSGEELQSSHEKMKAQPPKSKMATTQEAEREESKA